MKREKSWLEEVACPTLDKHKSLVALGLAGMLIAVLGQLVLPMFLARLLDGTLGVLQVKLPEPTWLGFVGVQQAGWMMGAILLLVVLGTWVDLRSWQTHAELIMHGIRTQVSERLLKLPMAWHLRHSSGQISGWLLGDLTLAQEFAIYEVRLGIKYSVLLAGSLILLFVTSWKLAILLLVVTVPGVILAVYFARKIRRLSTSVQGKLEEVSALNEEILLGMATIKAFGAELREISRQHSAISAFRDEAIHAARARAMFASMIVLIVVGSAVFFAITGSSRVRSGELTPGELTQFITYLSFAGSATGTLGGVISKWQRVRGALERVSSLWEEPVEAIHSPKTSQERTSKSQPVRLEPPEIRLEGVTFAYPDVRAVSALKDLNLCVMPGERIAIVGPNGSGKSTLVRLLLKFFVPQSGCILIDGVDLQSIPNAIWRKRVGVVPQEIALFGGTIRDNLLLGLEHLVISEHAIERAMEMAGCTDFVRRLPLGLDTIVESRGNQFSGGEKQRLALARAMVRDPKILILDEATSALDGESEKHIAECIEQLSGQKTVLVIAHRLETVKRADRIVVMREGSVVMQGKHEELIKEMGFYRQICETQLDDC